MTYTATIRLYRSMSFCLQRTVRVPILPARAIAVFLCLLLATSAWAGNNEGRAAYDAGDYATALRELPPLAEQGDAGAQFTLGNMYYLGHGVPEDYAEAVRWYRMAAEQGDGGAQFILGLMHVRGHGVPEDIVQAHKWFNLAATQGDKDAIKNRDDIAKKKTPADISKAQKLAREWLAAFKKRKGK